MNKFLMTVFCLGALAACGGNSGNPTEEAPTGDSEGDGGRGITGECDGCDDEDTPDSDTPSDQALAAPTLSANLLAANASFPANTFSEATTKSITDTNSLGYAFQVGVLSDDSSVIANANVLLGGGFFPTADPASGTATLQSTYDAVMFSNPTTDNGFVEVTTTSSTSAPITLTADFTDATFGTLTGTDGTLTVDATFVRGIGSLNGDVTYNGVDGDVSGFVGGAEVLGAFAGQNDTSVFAGGFSSN